MKECKHLNELIEDELLDNGVTVCLLKKMTVVFEDSGQSVWIIFTELSIIIIIIIIILKIQISFDKHTVIIFLSIFTIHLIGSRLG